LPIGIERDRRRRRALGDVVPGVQRAAAVAALLKISLTTPFE
jgi:precorrin-4 methylase